jgi:hypothetical protein
MVSSSAKRPHKKHPSSKKSAAVRHAASLRKISEERDLHNMIRLIGALFPERRDKDTKKALMALSDLSKKRGFKSLYGVVQGLLAENLSSRNLEKASDIVTNLFKKESGIDLAEKQHPKHQKKVISARDLLKGL